MTLENYAVFGKYFYHDLKHTLKAFNHKESKKCFKFIEKYKNDFYILMLADYERTSSLLPLEVDEVTEVLAQPAKKVAAKAI